MPVRLALDNSILADAWTDLNPFTSTADILAVALTMIQDLGLEYIAFHMPGKQCPPVWYWWQHSASRG